MPNYEELLAKCVSDMCGDIECPTGTKCSCRSWAKERAAYRHGWIMFDEPIPMSHRVFVYGTLKRGLPNHHLLSTATEFLGDAATVNTYRMIDTGGFPVILDDPDGKPVNGEVYTVDDATLARLDRLEGIRPEGGGMYERKTTDFTTGLANGKRLRMNALAYIYVGNKGPWVWPAWTKLNSRGELDWSYR
jgi:gamma-glutamylaminecyclotransferase